MLKKLFGVGGSRSEASPASPLRSSVQPPGSVRQQGAAGGTRGGDGFDRRWFGPGDRLDIGGFRIDGPCVYASHPKHARPGRSGEPSEIDVRLPVDRSRGTTEPLGYWPWYQHIDPGARYQYLEWLASGRRALPPQEGLLFLYYYGLERRLLIDRTDRNWCLQEIVRLRKLDAPRVGTKEGASFRRYSTHLLWFEVARTPATVNVSAFNAAMDLAERWTPDLLAAPLAWLAHHERPLPVGLAMALASFDPAAQRSVVTRRVPEEFESLFTIRYRETFGDQGMTLRVSKRPRRFAYQPASGGLEEQTCEVPSPQNIPSQFKQLPMIWNACIADLRKLSRASASIDDGELTVEVWEAMPGELRSGVDHPLTDDVSGVLRTDAQPLDGDGTGAVVRAGRLAELVGVQQRPRLTAGQSRTLAITLGHTGYGVVPDARFLPVRYGWDELVAILPGLDDDVQSERYNAAVCVLRLGLNIALADGHADDAELAAIEEHIEAVFDLSPTEEQRLHALRSLLLRTGSDIRPIARKLQDVLPPEARRSVGRLLVAIAATTDGIGRGERNALRSAFRALGLGPEVLEEAIAEVTPEADEREMTVQAKTRAELIGEAIPMPAGAETDEQEQAPAGLRLDRQAISAIMDETRQVSMLLAEAMAVDDERDEDAPLPADPAKPAAATVAVAAPGSGDDAAAAPQLGRYSVFYAAIIERDRWSEDEAGVLAREHGVMLSAAIETINDWAFDALGGPIIDEDGDGLAIDRSTQ